MNVFEFVFVSINGATMPLSNYQGQPLLIVNTASECEYTPQYTALQRLWMDYRQSGLVVIGIPCDDFGHLEPGDEAAIADFCEENYQIDFPMTGKYNLMGISAHPIIHSIREEFGDDATPRWNFHKYLIGRDGRLIAEFSPRTQPYDDKLVSSIRGALEL